MAVNHSTTYTENWDYFHILTIKGKGEGVGSALFWTGVKPEDLLLRYHAGTYDSSLFFLYSF